MRMLTSLLLIAFFISLNSCCDEPPVANSGGLPIRFIDSKNRRDLIYNSTRPIFPRDSLKVRDLATNQPVSIWLLNSGDLIISSVYESDKDQAAFRSEICKSFIVQFFQNDLDTLKLCYKMKATGKCDGVSTSEFSSIIASWNNKLIYSADGGVYHEIEIQI